MLLKNIKYIGCSAVLLYLIWTIVHIKYSKTPDFGVTFKDSRKYILLWTSPNSEPLSFLGEGDATFAKRNCSVRNCYVTSNRNFFDDIIDFDAVLFHDKEISKDPNIETPVVRAPHQLYIFASMESSAYYPIKKDKFNDYFNVTWTYKLDSDIYYGYMSIRNSKGEIIGPRENIHWLRSSEMAPISDEVKMKLKNKTKLGAWFVSNCISPSRREKVVANIQKELRKSGLSIDVYGQCGNKFCPRSNMSNCLALIEREYYFYFSLENSMSPDYVTEKLLHALKNYAVPVVYGGADYKRFMPDGAYVDAKRFNTTNLVKELLGIIKNKEKYFNYFQWHSHYSYHSLTESPDTDPHCRLCEYIHKPIEHKVVKNLKMWWNNLSK